MKYVSPSVKETAFNCPHCSALCTQFWYEAFGEPRSRNHPLPTVVGEEGAKLFNFDDIEDREFKKEMTDWANKMGKGFPYLEKRKKSQYVDFDLNNVSISRCYNCDQISVWIYDRLVYPTRGEAPPANPDMPEEIRRDYDEASTILDLSARGAAALIRLGIQKLCKHLGQPGKNINDDIKALVAGGLDPRIQKALDVVRVVGNNAVHPGQIDLKDDRATAESLFRLLNLIVEKMISEPKHVDEVYAALPEEARKAIEKRDGK
ncbi:DUF4145 domain-containing protein [Sinirhodobacter sp. WL0062]|uniref:DUF4145 domain-containing protein n=1 Tax=Rhodobacter flavimaris TaxID=2907145 RepID=A0ABS8YRH0_9RHOB|nr:DUF4145 domain-containing protein [Sinirhodobacter sp. WL0062]MCE5972477.1 DUF4145 domain-containing protein [Sinirhodobacter sp. WL0062]